MERFCHGDHGRIWDQLQQDAEVKKTFPYRFKGKLMFNKMNFSFVSTETMSWRLNKQGSQHNMTKSRDNLTSSFKSNIETDKGEWRVWGLTQAPGEWVSIVCENANRMAVKSLEFCPNFNHYWCAAVIALCEKYMPKEDSIKIRRQTDAEPNSGFSVATNWIIYFDFLCLIRTC